MQVPRPPSCGPRKNRTGQHIEIHELGACLMALNKWAETKLRGSAVTWYTDSTSAVRLFQRIEPLPKERFRVSRIVRAIRAHMARSDITIAVVWQARKLNGLADCLSHPEKDCS